MGEMVNATGAWSEKVRLRDHVVNFCAIERIILK
jgi:hypothetical protein